MKLRVADSAIGRKVIYRDTGTFLIECELDESYRAKERSFSIDLHQRTQNFISSFAMKFCKKASRDAPSVFRDVGKERDANYIPWDRKSGRGEVE